MSRSPTGPVLLARGLPIAAPASGCKETEAVVGFVDKKSCERPEVAAFVEYYLADPKMVIRPSK